MKTKLPEKIVSLFPPTIFDSVISKKRYAIYSGVGWFEVDKDFTYEDAMKIWSRWEAPRDNNEGKNTWKVESSKKGKFYTVKQRGNYWSCDCPSSMYHRKTCKHITKMKEQNSL